jgi:drug/metabolite transporter (DMT)-like permease
MNYSKSGYEIYRQIIFQFVLRRHITLWQFVGAALIVISIAIAKTPDILQIFSRSSTGKSLS